MISRASALLLATTGLAMLFASDTILPQLFPDLMPSASWLGQLIAAGWLSIALFNWNGRNTILGGIYGRPAVNLNLMLYLVSALALFKASGRSPAVFVPSIGYRAHVGFGEVFPLEQKRLTQSLR